MTTDNIFVPRSVIQRILSEPLAHNPNVCVRIPYRGYQVSVAMDSSHCSGDLSRSDIRVFDARDVEVTEFLMPEFATCGMVYGTGENLKAVFEAIDDMVAARPC